MAKRKKDAAAHVVLLERYERTISMRPLFGLERLVRVQRRKWNGILLCDNIMTVSDKATFSKSHVWRCFFPIEYKTIAPGFLGEPRVSAANQAPPEVVENFRDYGVEFKFYCIAEAGKTYSVECDIYRPFETHNGAARLSFYKQTQIANFVLKLDLSAYENAGYPVATPMCGFEPAAKTGRRKAEADSPGRLVAKKRGPGIWEWHAAKLKEGTLCWAWIVDKWGETPAIGSINVEKLATELSVNPRLAKDLHNFMSVCYYYVADVRSVNAIGHKMAADRTVLLRSLESIERLIGAEVIRRTQGKGLISITPAGHAVLDWWSRFYMRWTPIFPDAVTP